jgi:ubiquinone/menaquinone biosynthesis C-methylase UbiE
MKEESRRRRPAANRQQVRQMYDHLAGFYDRRWARYVRATTRATLARLHLRSGEHLLDLGCGTGALLQLVQTGIPGRREGGDLSLAMLNCARAKLPGRVRLTVSDAGELPFPKGLVDVVVSISSLHYWPFPERALAEVRRILRPGGRVVITDWCADYLVCRICEWLLHKFNRAHHYIYDRAECESLMKGAGFVDVRIEAYRVPWPWGIMTVTAKAPGGASADNPQ